MATIQLSGVGSTLLSAVFAHSGLSASGDLHSRLKSAYEMSLIEHVMVAENVGSRRSLTDPLLTQTPVLNCDRPCYVASRSFVEGLLMPIREIAIAIILDTRGRYLFQRRDDIFGIAHAGKISLFGGHREAGETYLECVVREVQEEIGYPVGPEDVEYLTSLEGSGDVVEGDLVHGEVYVLRDVPSDNLVVTEGSLTIVDSGRLVELEREFTPSTRFALGAFLSPSRS